MAVVGDLKTSKENSTKMIVSFVSLKSSLSEIKECDLFSGERFWWLLLIYLYSIRLVPVTSSVKHKEVTQRSF